MKESRSTIKMPELFIIGKVFFIGIVGAEIYRIGFHLGERLSLLIVNVDWLLRVVGTALCLIICLVYSWKRDLYSILLKMIKSLRIDLFAISMIGIWFNYLISSNLDFVHVFFKEADPHLALAILTMLILIVSSPFLKFNRVRKNKNYSQLYFFADEEISSCNQDFLAADNQAKDFAETVLASSDHAGLIFGVDGPWGIGKTSFINLLERHWTKKENESTIVFRFEPLRYASEQDLTSRFIRELSTTIQKYVFIPEFRPIASRYSRMLRGKAEVSFFGLKLSLEPTSDTVDELLNDIDDALKYVGRRVIIVVDDLDRLEPKAVNNVLFTVRKTLKLSQASYILCYDTENLIATNDEGEKAREFLEKFVSVKLNLFVDSSSISKFLRHDWRQDGKKFLTVPSDSMFKLSSILAELADILDGDLAAKYIPIIGDLRKVKRFINAALLIQIERTDLSKTDFNRRDLINLMLLHLNFPGLFRKIYSEETEGRSGIFSAIENLDGPKFSNSTKFTKLVEQQSESAAFLLKQLFDIEELKLNDAYSRDDPDLEFRACFNRGGNRNLEKYLKLITKFVTPEPRETFILYKNSVDQIFNGASIADTLNKSEFSLEKGEYAHDQFWRVLVNRSYEFTHSIAEDSINTLIDYLPKYSSLDDFQRGLRIRSIYSLSHLLDGVGWGRTGGQRRPNSKENIIEIAHRIFGEGKHDGQGIITRLTQRSQGTLGWNDLMLFRLTCSADRRGELHNLHSALILHQDKDASTEGLLTNLALNGMRELSQEIFRQFKSEFIVQNINFFAEVDATSSAEFCGESEVFFRERDLSETLDGEISLDDRIAIARTTVKSFVIYQLSNNFKPSGSGVGCGFYDEVGAQDSGEIAGLMNDYVFGVCFNPRINEDNVFYFIDYCLSNLSHTFYDQEEGAEYVPKISDLPGALNPLMLGAYWKEHREFILQSAKTSQERRVFTSNYIATYGQNLPRIFDVLDELLDVQKQ